VQRIAETARARFEGLPGLRSKAFTLNATKREATNFYVWDSDDAAKGFHTDELLERLTGLYGVRPSVEFVQIATLVENVLSIAPSQHYGQRGTHFDPSEQTGAALLFISNLERKFLCQHFVNAELRSSP
jgi:hypothetical protein